jgi:hypothetical protein
MGIWLVEDGGAADHPTEHRTGDGQEGLSPRCL